MDNISSEKFLQAWLQVVDNRKDYLLSIWRNNTEFTKTIKGDDASVMHEIANKLNLKCYHSDYYSLDTVLYKEDDLVPGRTQNSYWFRDIRVAFEHENNFRSGLYKEISHLLITNCDLRVLVTYPNTDKEAKKELEYLHNIIKGNRQYKSISKQESFLIILGSESGFLWEGYVFKEENWKPINCNAASEDIFS